MKPAKSGTRKQRIILYYTIAVVIPGIILGFMAYRGILNDQMLREQESRRKLEGDSRLFFTAIDSGLSRLMDRQLADTVSLRQSDPAVLALFVRDTAGSTRLISHSLLYIPDPLSRKTEPTAFSRGRLDEGARFEFQEQKLPEALDIYKGIATTAIHPTEKDLAFIALARVYKKLNQTDKAVATYLDIRDNHAGCLLNGQIPLGLTADLEMTRISFQARDTSGFRDNALHLMNQLLHPVCEYDVNQFDLFFQSLKGLIPEGDHSLDSLIVEIERRKVYTDYLIRLINETDLVLSSRNNPNLASRGGNLQIPLQINEFDLVVNKQIFRNGSEGYMVTDFTRFLESAADRLIMGIDPESKIGFEVRNANDSLIYQKKSSQKNGSLAYVFPDNLPPWRLLLTETPTGFFSALVTSGRGLYISIFILIMFLMVLGLVFTIFTLNQELRLNKLKSEFISNVSHELKSPLTSIRQMTEMLDQDRVRSEARKKEYYTSMVEQSVHLSHLIDNILDFSRMEDDRKKYRFEEHDLNDLLVRFLEGARERITETGIKIRYTHPDEVPLIQVDKDAILQVFYNLVDNAVKYSGTSKLVEVFLLVNPENLIIRVQDHGMGIPKRDQEKIFERFYRCEEAQAQGIKGSGIGLTIVRRIVEAHHGELTLESTLGAGSTFSVYLPINQTHES